MARWGDLEGRLRDLLMCYVGITILSGFLFYAYQYGGGAILQTVSSVTLFFMALVTVYSFWQADMDQRYFAFNVVVGVGVFSLIASILYLLVFPVDPDKAISDPMYVVAALPWAGMIFYSLIGGPITLIDSVFGLRSGGKSEEEIIEEVLDDEEQEKKSSE